MIRYHEIGIDKLDEYDKIPFFYITTKKYQLNKINRGLGGISLELVDVPEFYKDFGEKTEGWKSKFDISNWKFFVAYNENDEMVGGCTLAMLTPNLHMLEGKDDLAVLWDIRVSDKYKHQGIGQQLFDMAKGYAKDNGFKKLKVECQNTNPAAVNFYHKQGMELCIINEYSYSEFPDETQFIWYLDL